jgi:hypothetical protein
VKVSEAGVLLDSHNSGWKSLIKSSFLEQPHKQDTRRANIFFQSKNDLDRSLSKMNTHSRPLLHRRPPGKGFGAL